MVLSVREAAARLGVSAQTVYGLCAAKRLRHSRVGLGRGKIAILEEAIAEYLGGREVGPAHVAVPAPRRKVVLHHLELP